MSIVAVDTVLMRVRRYNNESSLCYVFFLWGDAIIKNGYESRKFEKQHGKDKQKASEEFVSYRHKNDATAINPMRRFRL